MTHRLFRALALVCLLAGTAPAFSAEPLPEGAPSEAAVRELLTASEVQKMLDTQIGEVRRALDTNLAGVMSNPELNDAQRKVVEEWKQEFVAVLTDYLSWKNLEPVFIDIYRRSFTREEVESMVAFYRTPAGRALVSKMPLVMQNSMTAMQSRMAELQPRMQKLQEDLQAKLQAAAAQN